MYTYLTLSYSSKISRATARTSRDAYNLDPRRIRVVDIRSIISVPVYDAVYQRNTGRVPSIYFRRTHRQKGSRGANLIYLSQVPSASPPFLLPFAPRGSSTWYPWYTCISFSAPLRRFLCLSPLRCHCLEPDSATLFLPRSFVYYVSVVVQRGSM